MSFLEALGGGADPMGSKRGLGTDYTDSKPENSGGQYVEPGQPNELTVKWRELKESGGDVVGPCAAQLAAVSREELQKHNSKNDCWICVRGVVYDVTKYYKYHPGGRSQIVRHAGEDATLLFERTHDWVQISEVLDKCVVGPMEQ